MDVLYSVRKQHDCQGLNITESEELTSLCNWKKVVSWDFGWNDEMSGGTPCRIQLCIVSPNGEGVPNKPASILTFYDFSKVLFSDLIWFNIESPSKSQVWDLSIWWFARLLCKAFAAFWNFTRTDGLELGIWKISGDLGWTSVLISDIQWLCGWISGDWPMEITSLTWKWLRSDRSHCNF